MSRAAIIVVGGGARRLDGVAKPWLHVDGVTILDRILDAVDPHVSRCILVGECPVDWARNGIEWTREEPAGSGPAVAVATGLQLLDDTIEEVLLVAGDAPFIAEPLALLMNAEIHNDGVAIESEGQVQFLCARLRHHALARAVAAGGSSMRSIYDLLEVRTVPALLRDADTWEDVALLRQETAMNEWLTEVAKKLAIEPIIDIDAVLELTRDVAHHTERKNAPLTSYLLGYAVAQQGLSPARIAEIAAEIGRMARERG